MTNPIKLLTLVLGIPMFALACGAGPDGESPEGALSSLTRHSSCERTVCEKVHDDCMSYIDECFGQCYGMSYEYSYQCISICNDYECSPCTANECAERGYEFEITAPRDEQVFAACERFRSKLEQCGGDASAHDCDRYSRLERPEVASVYDCAANIACDGGGPKCAPAATDWGHQFCIALNGQCDHAGLGCTEEDAALLDEATAWLKDDVREQAMKCIQEDSCTDVEACVDAWFQTVFP